MKQINNSTKHLLIYRHAKSDWDADYEDDFYRPLSKRGRKSAEVMGNLLSKSKQVPDLIITSAAVRAKETLKISKKTGNWKCKIKESDILYFQGVNTILNLVKDSSNKHSSIMLIGHEPKLTQIVSSLIGGGDVRLPTASMARIDFFINDWVDLKPGFGTLRWLLQPSFFME